MMRHTSSMVLLAGVVLAALGCTTTHVVKEKPVPDPLLTSKKPVEGRSHAGSERAVVDRDDLLPPPPPPSLDTFGPRTGETSVVQMLGVRSVSR